MSKGKTGWLWLGLFIFGCGGTARQSQGPASPDNSSQTDRTVEPSRPGAPCTLPIESPGDVWQRVEEARALPESELLSSCGLPFVDTMSEWRPPPVDLLGLIVLNEAQNREGLVAWVTQNAKAGKKAAVHGAAMDIVGDWKIGEDTAVLASRAQSWQPLAAQFSYIGKMIEEVADLQNLLASLMEIHELRCKLEVNPLGFAVSCIPIHSAKEKINLTWKEEIQDGLIRQVALSKCTGSRSCPKLQNATATFAGKYQAARMKAEALETEVFREQVLEWLKLPPFSKTSH